MTPFAVTASTFAQYEAFKKDCEELGWKYAPSYFNEGQSKTSDGMRFSDGKFSWAIGLSPTTFNLGTQYAEALEFAREQIKPVKVKMRSAREVWLDEFDNHGDNRADKVLHTYATEAMQADREILKEMIRKHGCELSVKILSSHPYPELH